MAQQKNELNIKLAYGKYCTLNKNAFLDSYNFSESGLSSEKAYDNFKKFGVNEISQAKTKKWYNYFFESLLSPFNSILLGISFVLIYTDIFLANTPNYANIIVILVLVVISTFLDFFQEFNSNKAAEKLKELVATSTIVIRDGKQIHIPIKNITIGDVVESSAARMIPPDL